MGLRDWFKREPKMEPVVLPDRVSGPNNVPTTPVGHGMQEYYPYWVGEDQGLLAIDDLVAKKGLEPYREMDDRDDMVRASTLMIILGRLSTDWKVTPASDDPKDVEIADATRYMLEDLDGTSVHRLLQDAMDALRVGFVAINRVMRAPYPAGHQWAGVMGWRTFRSLPQETITFKTDQYGEIEPNGVWQSTPRLVIASTDPAHFDHLDRDKFILWTWDKRSGHPLGRSMYRPCWRWYFMKGQLQPWMASYLENYGHDAVYAEVPEGTGEGEKARILEALRTFQNMQRMVVPVGTKVNVIAKTGTTSMSNFETGVDLANRGIARAMLQPTTLIDQTGTGSYALSKSQKGTFEWVLTHLGRTLRDEVMMEQVIRPFVRHNYGPNVELPSWDFEPLSEEDKVALSTVYKTLVEMGLPIGERTMYETFRVDRPDDDEPIVGGKEEEESPTPPDEIGEDGEEMPPDDKGLKDLADDIAGARSEEELVAVLQGRGKRSGSRARDLWM